MTRIWRWILSRVTLELFGSILLGGAWAAYAAAAAANTNLTLALASLAATVGLVANISFNFNRTIEDKKHVDELNRRSGGLLGAVIYLFYGTLFSLLMGMLPKDFVGVWKIFEDLKTFILPLMIGVVVFLSIILAFPSLTFFEIYIMDYKKDNFRIENCQPKFDKYLSNIVKFVNSKDLAKSVIREDTDEIQPKQTNGK